MICLSETFEAVIVDHLSEYFEYYPVLYLVLERVIRRTVKLGGSIKFTLTTT